MVSHHRVEYIEIACGTVADSMKNPKLPFVAHESLSSDDIDSVILWLADIAEDPCDDRCWVGCVPEPWVQALSSVIRIADANHLAFTLSRACERTTRRWFLMVRSLARRIASVAAYGARLLGVRAD
jgi:hypothetical protein